MSNGLGGRNRIIGLGALGSQKKILPKGGLGSRIPPKADLDTRNSLLDIHKNLDEIKEELNKTSPKPVISSVPSPETETFRNVNILGDLRVQNDLTVFGSGSITGPEIGGLVGTESHNTQSLDQSVVQVNGSLAVLGSMSAETIRARRFVGTGFDSGIGTLCEDVGLVPEGNVSTGETTLTGTQFVIYSGILLDGQGFNVKAYGTLAANTNAKTIKFYVGSGTWTLLSAYATSVANNRFYIDFNIWRADEAANKARGAGIITYGAATGAAPTLNHIWAAASSGVTWTSNNYFYITAQGGATDDIQLYQMHVSWLK